MADYVFSISMEFENELNRGVITKKLRKIFDAHEHHLRYDATARKEREDVWLIAPVGVHYDLQSTNSIDSFCSEVSEGEEQQYFPRNSKAKNMRKEYIVKKRPFESLLIYEIDFYSWEERHKQRYGWGRGDVWWVKPSDRKNPHILKWWNKSHDELMAKLIEQKQWYWYEFITDEILAITPPEKIETWKSEDPLFKDRECGGQNDRVQSLTLTNNILDLILRDFALSRAQSIYLTRRIRKPQEKTCPLCGEKFNENSLYGSLVRKLRLDHFDFCPVCLLEITSGQGENDNATKQEVIEYIHVLTNILQYVPSYYFGGGKEDFIDMDSSQRFEVFKLLKRKPSITRVKDLFGSWFAALVEAGILKDGARRTGRGIQCLAKDGHVCLSLGEKTIDDYLSKHNIPHKKEVLYPEGRFRADFSIDGVFIEYFGLRGDTKYDLKTKEKQKLCRKHGIRLISIYPEDLVSVKRLESKLKKLLNKA